MENTEREKFNLITIYGDVITITVNAEQYDEMYNEMLDDLDANNLYSVGDFGELVIFKGHKLTVIDFRKIIGRD